MDADTKFVDDPDSSPRTLEKWSGRSRIVRWLLITTAIVLMLFSLQTAWRALELANQEYLHIWNPRRAIYDIEINGSPFSNAEAIRFGITTVLIHWGIAAAFLIASRFFCVKAAR